MVIRTRASLNKTPCRRHEGVHAHLSTPDLPIGWTYAGGVVGLAQRTLRLKLCAKKDVYTSADSSVV